MKFSMIQLGHTKQSRKYVVSKEEIITFAKQFDPQHFHIDEEKAKKTRFKGLIASGIHTLALSFKLLSEISIIGEDVIAGKGVDKLKLLKPVFPGDALYVSFEVIKKKPVRQNGEVTLLLTTYKNEGTEVMNAEINILVSN